MVAAGAEKNLTSPRSGAKIRPDISGLLLYG